jgi:hypothetical protein
MTTSYGILCDDFYINMTLNTELELPTNRDTILHFFERIQRQYPTMSSFYQRASGDFCLDEDRESGSYRWVSVENNRICAGYVNPDSLEMADEMHKLILEVAPFALGVNHLDVNSLDLLFGMDFDFDGNHDEVLADALLKDSAFASLLDIHGSTALGFDPAILISLSEDCRLQARFSCESRTGAYQVRTGKYKENDQISLYLSVRQYPLPTEKFSCLTSYEMQRDICIELMDDKMIPNFVQPVTGAIAQRQ